MSATDIPVARPSSTVVLVRDADAGPEICLVRRHAEATFGGAYVFPGGVVDATDNVIDRRFVDIDPVDADRRLELAGDGLGYYVAAVRELFEETGVLLANGVACDSDIDDARRALNAGALDWNRFVAGRRMKLACSSLRYFSHWITPDVIPKRFSTRFFLVRMPDGQQACHDDIELTDAIWKSAQGALAAARDGELALHFPTLRTLEQLAGQKSVAELEAWAATREQSGVVAIHPVMPGGNPQAEPRLRTVGGRPRE